MKTGSWDPLAMEPSRSIHPEHYEYIDDWLAALPADARIYIDGIQQAEAEADDAEMTEVWRNHAAIKLASEALIEARAELRKEVITALIKMSAVRIGILAVLIAFTWNYWGLLSLSRKLEMTDGFAWFPLLALACGVWMYVCAEALRDGYKAVRDSNTFDGNKYSYWAMHRSLKKLL